MSAHDRAYIDSGYVGCLKISRNPRFDSVPLHESVGYAYAMTDS